MAVLSALPEQSVMPQNPQDFAARRLATKTSTSPLTTGTIFNFRGSIAIISISGRVKEVIQSQATTVRLGIVSDALAEYFICATKDVNAFVAGSLLSITGTAATAMVGTTAVGAMAPAQASVIVATCVATGIIRVTYGAASTGQIVWDVLWEPVGPGGDLIAA